MKYMTKIAAALVVASLITIQERSFAQEGCHEDTRATYVLKIHVSDDRRPTKVTHKGQAADDFEVCIGDSVEWQLVGSGRRFYVDFVAGAPFDGETKQNSANGKILVTIGGELAEPGNYYKYDIGIVEGEVLDPRIKIRED